MRNFLYQKCSVILMLFCISCASAHGDTFDEELMLKPLPSGYIYAFFQFTTLWEAPNSLQTLQHSHLFPRGLGEILGRHRVDELHFTLTEGLWRYKKWGYPFQNAGPGAEISAWFNQNVSNVDKEWIGLTNSLAGLLCASLNFVDSSNSLSPEFSMQPTSALNHKANSSYLRYSTLPRETACTENLTPFKKLLPCNSKRGLAMLLNSAYIHNTNYHSIGIHFRSICRNSECTKTSLELRQTVSLIYDILADDSQDWSIRKLFGTGLRGACPLATISNIYVDITTNKTIHTYKLMPEPNAKVSSLRGGQKNMIAVYDIRFHTSKGMINVAAYYNSPNFDTKGFIPIFLASRYIIGYGQQKGTLVTKLRNNHWQPLDVILLENIPWYLSLYLHTTKITCNGKPIRPLIQRYVPGKERERPYYLELVLQLPPHSVTKFSIDFDYLFLKWQEYPPDANHGFYAGPAIITASLPIARNYTALPLDGSTISSSFNASRENYIVELRTDVLLISLPTPDFSMPYNVICLACTAVALAFGPLHNISTKRLVLKRIQQSWWKNNKGMFKNIVVGMSGGVDSAVAGLLLKNKGFNVKAVFMKNWDIVDETGQCIAEKDFADAEWVCKKLKIPLVRVDFVKEYWNDVFSDLIEHYQNGMTPNPDIQCNKRIKFDKFYHVARNELKADAIATGHYVRTTFGPYLENYKENTNVKLLKGKDFSKDQTLFLSQVPQESLRKCMFPIGEYLKQDVKKIAKEAQLTSVLNKKESMGICFIGSRNFQKFIQEYIENKPGNFIDFTKGSIVGTHEGVHHWTVGQRSKLGGFAEPFMIFHKNLETNDIFVVPGSNHPALYSDLLITSKPRWINEEPVQLKESRSILHCDFRFQHRKPLVPCSVFRIKNKLIVRISKPLRAITQGQYAVFYLKDECLGSAKILHPGPSYYSLGKEVTEVKSDSE